MFYSALFHKDEDGGFWVLFPDLPECFTEGDDMAQAYEMAVDALGVCITSRKIDIPIPSSPELVKQEKNSYVVVVEFDMLAYKKRTNSAAVKKTLSIPQWLNEEALALNINFSQVLQDACGKKWRYDSFYFKRNVPESNWQNKE